MLYSVPSHARPAACWLTFLCLLPWSTACAPLAPMVIRPEPPPAALAQACEPGPGWPDGDVAPLGALIEIVRQREAAAAECRARHRGLARWAEGVTQ